MTTRIIPSEDPMQIADTHIGRTALGLSPAEQSTLNAADATCQAIFGTSTVRETAHSIMQDAKEMTSLSPAALSDTQVAQAVIRQPDVPVRRLYCTCCGESFQGRQFHNQDTGYGMGECCADRVLRNKPFGHDAMSLAEFERTYGIRGYHFAIPAADGYDYRHQAWVVNGRYVACGHPQTTPCDCYGRIHEGESPAPDADVH